MTRAGHLCRCCTAEIKPLHDKENIKQIFRGYKLMSDLVVQADEFGSDLHMFGSALRFLCNPIGESVGIANPRTDESYIKILALGTLDKEVFLNFFAEFRKVTEDLQSYQKSYSKKIENLLACFIETWLQSNDREEFYASTYREFLAK